MSNSPSTLLRQVVEIGADERGVDAELGRDPGRELDGPLGEVDARDLRTQAGPRERIDPEVALEVQQGLASDRADLLDLVVTNPDAAPLEFLEVVEGASGIDLGPLVPQRSVRREVLVHPVKDGRRLEERHAGLSGWSGAGPASTSRRAE